MKRKWLIIGISTIAVILLTLTSLSNVVGYQTVQSSNQSYIKERINQRELLFQTIVDIANNKEIQGIILKSQMSKGIFPTSEFPVVTKNLLKMMYFLGLILSKVISKSRIQPVIGKYQFNNQEIPKEISAVIEKDAILNADITQLQNSECDCENNIKEEKTSIMDSTDNPIICGFLFVVILTIAVIFFPLNIILEYLIHMELMLLVKLLLLITFPIMLPFEIIYITTVFLLMIFCVDIPTPKSYSVDIGYEEIR